MNLARALVAGSLALAAGLPYLGVSLTPLVDRESTWSPRWADLAAQSGPGGFLVWESNRTGRWRIFRRNLDGSGMRQLIADEPGREHFCPHLSPDGRKIVYMSMEVGRDLYWPEPDKENGVLHVADAQDGSSDRVIAESCRGYYEDRAALWIDDDHLFFIDGDGDTQKLTLSTGERELMFAWNGKHGWFPNATETHISAGWPSFPTYDRESKSILFRNKLSGCQPWFSRDGVWGFWTQGAGGPIQRYHLKTRQATDIIARHDPRLPEFRRYTYFPMLSQCQNLFAFAASFYEHDHFESDYDVFVARIDPFTLELEEDPIRYTFDRGCDRFPDLHFDPMRLGKQRGMAPFTADFSTAVDAGWTFDYGDGSPTTPNPQHVYGSPSTYWVVASRGAERRRGRVRVDPTAGPRAIEARLVGLRQIEVEFDDPIEVVGTPVAKLGKGGIDVVTAAPGDDPVVLRLTLDADLRSSTTLAIEEGVVGHNGLPVRAPRMRVQQRTWPLEPGELRFAFQHRAADNRAIDHASGAWRRCELETDGEAFYDHRGALRFGPGDGVASTDDVAGIATAVRERDAVMVEAAIEPASLDQQGTVLELLAADGQRALAVLQVGTMLRCIVRASGDGDEPLQFEFGPVTERMHFSAGFNAKWNGVLTAQIDGTTRAFREDAPGHLTEWDLSALRLGDGWCGTMHHVAIYSEMRTNEHFVDSHLSAAGWEEEHPETPARRMRGRLTAKSPIPTLDEIKPYSEAAVTFEYATEEGPVRAMHWVLLNRQPTQTAALKIGDEVELVLEPLDAHPEMTERFNRDGLAENFDIDVWHGVARSTR